ncbi:MAG: glycoside hydrolase family 3 C-terminal domain-containing protein [Actinobacteria bacterium]|nr:glycoside hydrolase family 3 C-terminal domain-containing protein [Actinomycetota bacterium]
MGGRAPARHPSGGVGPDRGRRGGQPSPRLGLHLRLPLRQQGRAAAAQAPVRRAVHRGRRGRRLRWRPDRAGGPPHGPDRWAAPGGQRRVGRTRTRPAGAGPEGTRRVLRGRRRHPRQHASSRQRPADQHRGRRVPRGRHHVPGPALAGDRGRTSTDRRGRRHPRVVRRRGPATGDGRARRRCRRTQRHAGGRPRPLGRRRADARRLGQHRQPRQGQRAPRGPPGGRRYGQHPLQLCPAADRPRHPPRRPARAGVPRHAPHRGPRRRLRPCVLRVRRGRGRRHALHPFRGRRRLDLEHVTPPTGPADDAPRPERAHDIDRLVAALELEQKVRLLTGASFWTTYAEPAVGLRSMVMSDGPVGVRGTGWDERDTSATLPSPTAQAATWDPTLVARLGELLASAARRKDVDVLLAPTLNLPRSPLAGRHFECYSEDPLLTGAIAAAYVRGVQTGGVGTTAKHYVANDSETQRFTLDVAVDERVLRELYLAPFERVVRDAGCWLVMTAYNAVNGHSMTESPLLDDPLTASWGFDGVVVSDWTAVRSVVASASAAQDLAMPGPHSPWTDGLVDAVRDGQVDEATIDRKVRRLLRLASRVGALDAVPVTGPRAAAIGTDDQRRLLRAAAAAGTVLVRNHGPLLPLDPATLQRVAVLGPSAASPRIQGGGSAAVTPEVVVSPLDGIRAMLGPDVAVDHAVGARISRGPEPVDLDDVTDPVTGEPGLRVRLLDADGVELRSEQRLAGTLVWTADEVPPELAAVEVHTRLCADVSGCWQVAVAGSGHFTLDVAGATLVDQHIEPEADDPAAVMLAPPYRGGSVDLVEGETVEVGVRHRVEHIEIGVTVVLGVERPTPSDEEELDRAVALAADADAAVVVVGTTERIESEGFDRTTLALPGRQDELVACVAQANPSTVVVVNAGGPVLMPWRTDVAAVLLMWFPGQEFGGALADVLDGTIEPGGRLTTTWPVTEDDAPVLDTTPVDGTLVYDEGLDIGYRAWLRSGRTPAYWFGHGLGYTTWSYEAIAVTATGHGARAQVRVTNAGRCSGREVVQVYLARPDSAVERPVRWLAGFAAVTAEAGASVEATVDLPARAFAHWSTDRGGWMVEPGTWHVLAGRSAADLPLTTTLERR